ncbi:transcription factor [Fusarium sporotrichioides]|uniref:Transcription factor n=1 Tax=Fusarium sporotrichioides TaxID=5514 RepID=A0A395S6A4_FUSSP|nr:transcription factor [Fusarium sporotrichioides]
MSLAKRNNGCYECCKRRLKCDKTEPECLKCQKKGISCSGQGLRCRFSSHMATTATPMTLTFTSTTSSSPQTSPNQPEKSFRWVEPGKRFRKDHSASSDDVASPSSDDSFDSGSGAVIPYAQRITIHPALNAVSSSQTRKMFSHFSEIIASHMVVLDSNSNGYRDVILPLACHDDNLAQAVSVVSAFHLGQKDPKLQHAAETGHQAIVQKLRRDSLQLSPEQLFNPYILATILVLLVGETITGADNYSYLLEMLNCLTSYPDWITMLPPSLKEFFLQQIKMFQLFGVPLANESKGLQVLTGPEAYLDFMAYPELPPDSEHAPNIEVIRSAIFDACSIYRRRAESSLSDQESIHLVEQLRQKVLNLDASTKGVHALVWTYFVAAAESILPEHREFFSTRLAGLYSVTNFGSIPVAVKALTTIWGMQGTRRWTEIVSSETPILIM